MDDAVVHHIHDVNEKRVFSILAGDVGMCGVIFSRWQEHTFRCGGKTRTKSQTSIIAQKKEAHQGDP